MNAARIEHSTTQGSPQARVDGGRVFEEADE